MREVIAAAGARGPIPVTIQSRPGPNRPGLLEVQMAPGECLRENGRFLVVNVRKSDRRGLHRNGVPKLFQTLRLPLHLRRMRSSSYEKNSCACRHAIHSSADVQTLTSAGSGFRRQASHASRAVLLKRTLQISWLTIRVNNDFRNGCNRIISLPDTTKIIPGR